MRSTPLLATAGAAVAVLALSPAAHAAVPPATYGGLTKQGDAIVFTTSSGGRKALKAVIAFRATCESGMSFAFHEVLPVSSSSKGLPLRRVLADRNSGGVLRGQIFDTGGTAAGSAAFQVAVTVRFTKTTMRGTLDATVVEIDQPGIQPATEPPAGATIVDRCATGKVSFTGTRSPGRVYGGATSQDEPVVLILDAARRNVRQAGVGWHASCTPDGYVDFPDDLRNFPLRGGAFGDVFRWSPSDGTVFGYRFSGKVTRRTASGSLTVDVERTPSNRTCSTGALRWTATSG